MSPMLYMELRRLKPEGRASAFRASLKDPGDQDFSAAVDAITADIQRRNNEARDIPGASQEIQARPKSGNVSDAAASQPEGHPGIVIGVSHKEPGKTDSNDANPYSTDILDIARRLIEKKRDEGTEPKTLTQIEQVVSLFVEIIDIHDLTALWQHRLSRFVDAMRLLPKNYRKSPKDKDKPISYFLDLGRTLPAEQRGLATGTINRNLTFCGMVVKQAAADGQVDTSRLDLSGLRRRVNRRATELRCGFTAAEGQAIFRNPIWTGFKSIFRPRSPGDVLLKDGLFWVPVICALTGARRGEIAGLAPDDLVQLDEIWCFDIRHNGLRNLKNDESSRFIPLHSQLIDLGLLKHVAHQRASGELFPDLRPSASESHYGESLDYMFREAKKDQIENQDKKSFHSFRHYVAHVLNNEKDVRGEWRDAILGHQGKSTGVSVYGSGIEVTILRSVIEILPRIKAFDALCDSGSSGKNSAGRLRYLPPATSRRAPRKAERRSQSQDR